MTARTREGVGTPGTIPAGARAAAALAATLTLAWPAAAQELPHPRRMDLPEVSVERPDPAGHRLELDNGLVAYVAGDRRVPLVTVTAIVDAGTAREPAGAVASLARALARGPSDETRGHFSAQLRAMAAELSVSTTPERLEATLDVPAEDAARALDLLARTLRSPLIAPADLEAVAAPAPRQPRRRGSLGSALLLFRRHLFADHPYGPAGERAGPGLTLRDVRAAHRRLVVPGATTLAVSGDLDPPRIRELVRRSFGDWSRGESPAAPDPPEPPALEVSDARRVHLYPADKLQGWVVLGHELPPVPDEDRAALEVMNYVLGGGHFDTRLFRATRDRRGLTNDDSGFPEARIRGPGTYTFRTSGRPEAIKLLVELTFREIERIRSQPVTDRELFVAKGALAEGAYAERWRSGRATARSLADEWATRGDHGLSADYPARIRGVTADDVRDAARRYLHPRRMQIVIVGPLDEIRSAPAMEDERALEAWGPVRVHARR